MQDAANTLMLICAIFASMAFGVLSAYGICRFVFIILGAHARSLGFGAANLPTAREPQIATPLSHSHLG